MSLVADFLPPDVPASRAVDGRAVLTIGAAVIVTALEIAVFAFGMRHAMPVAPPSTIAIRLVTLPAPPVSPDALPMIETHPPPPTPAPMVKQPARIVEQPAPQPLPVVPTAKPRPPAPRHVAHRNLSTAETPLSAPIPAPAVQAAPRAVPASPGGGSMGARAIYRPMPAIPEEMRHRAVTMVAVARFRVAADGAASVELIQPTPDPRFNTALLATLRTWRFFPAMANGRPVASTVDIRIPISVR